MKNTFFTNLPVAFLLLFPISPEKKAATTPASLSPLSAYSSAWDNEKYLECNTAVNASYLSEEEKETIYILNLARMNPVLFANTVVKQYPDKSSQIVNRNSAFYKSLLETLQHMKPLNLLYPDLLCFNSAKCHAITTGKAGTVTHERTTEECRKQQNFSGECCHYGNKTALDILMSLLIDEDVPSLGHRYVCLGSYSKIGVSIQPHISYRSTAVLDFKN